MICRHCLYQIALSSTDSWRLTWSPDDDSAPYECTEHDGGHEPVGGPNVGDFQAGAPDTDSPSGRRPSERSSRQSDPVPKVSATDAARNFFELLDAVEHRGEHFTIVRRGKVVARLGPVQVGQGAEIKALLQRHGRDPAQVRDVTSSQDLLEIESRPWADSSSTSPSWSTPTAGNQPWAT